MAAVKRVGKDGKVSYVGGASLNAKQQAEVDAGRATLGYGYAAPAPVKAAPSANNKSAPAAITPPAPVATIPNQFQYSLKDGTLKTVSAKDAAEAQRLAAADVNSNPRTGVALLQQSTTALRNQFDQNAAKLDERLARGTSTQNGSTSLTITRDLDNGDGTRTVTYSDGTTARVSATKNTDGTETYKEIGDEPTDDEDDPYGLGEQESTLTRQIQQEKASVSKTLDKLMGQMDIAYDGLISGLKANYEARAAAMIESNKRLLRGKQTLGMREGRARYTPITEGGLLSDEEKAGEARIGALQAEMLKGIAEASVARADSKMKFFQEKTKQLADLDKKLREEVTALWDKAQARDQEIRDREKADRDARKEDLTYQTDRAESVAETVGDALEQFKTIEEKQAFLDQYSAKTGIDPAILLSSINSARRKVAKEELDMTNTRSTISTRESSEAREQRKEKFNPSSDERAKVGKYLAKNGTDDDTTRAETDKDFFYYILDKAEEEEV